MTAAAVRVLHVDDEPRFGDLVSTFLERERDELVVVTERCVEDAIDRLETDDVDCIVSDYDMPTANGIEFLERVRAAYPDLPYVLFTGKGSEEVASDAIAAGVTDYLQKRGGTEQYELLANRIVNVVDRYRAERRADEQERVSDVIRRVNQALVRADTRREIEAAIPDVLTESEVYRFAWMGRYDDETGRVVPSNHAGAADDYLDGMFVTDQGDEPEGGGPGGRALRSKSVAVTTDVAADPAFEPWREAALDRGFRSVAAVPIRHEGDCYGLIAAYANRPDAFDEGERQLLSTVGANVGQAIAAIETTDALRESRNRNRAISEAIPDLVLVYDADGYYEEVITSRPELLVVDPDEAEGRHITDELPEGAARDILTAIDRTVETGETQSVEYELDVEGTPRCFEGRTTLLTDDTDSAAVPQVILLSRDVTDRKRIESNLREEKRRFQGVVETNPGGVLVADADGQFVFANERVEQVLEMDADEILDRSTYDERWNLRDLDGDFLDREDDPFYRVMQADEPVYDIRFTVESPGRSTLYLSVNGAPLHDGDGNIDRVLFSVTDITPHVERERELRTINEQIQRLQRFTTDLQAAEEPGDIYEMTVEAARDILEFDWAGISVAVDGWFEIESATEPYPFDPGDRNLRVDEGVAGRVYRTGESWLTHDMYEDDVAKPADDSFRSGIAVRLGELGVFLATSGTVGFFDDVDVELAELLCAHVTEALERAENEQVIRGLNEKVERLHGVATELQTCQTAEEVYALTIDAAEDILDFDSSVISVPEEGYFEFVAVSDDSPFSVGGSHIPVDEGTVGHAFGTGDSRLVPDIRVDEYSRPVDRSFRSSITVPIGDHGVFQASSGTPNYYDATDLELAELLAATVAEALSRVERERIIRKREQELTRQNERLERFASIVSHDLRNPLTVAKGHLEALDENDTVAEIRLSLDRIETIVADVLELARQGETIEERTPVSLESTVRQAWRTVDTDLATLTVDGSDRLRAAESRFLELLENLFRNAVKHGGHDVSVRVAATEGGFVVEDDGPGIPEADREQVLEMGYTTAADGTGFGLAIVSEVANAHGWTLSVGESDTGGARFTFEGVEWVEGSG